MSTSLEIASTRKAVATRRLVAGLVLFLALAVVGLLIVKWSPYWTKVHTVAATHAAGTSIVTGAGAQAPPVGWHAAWSYAAGYFTAVWKAVALALILGASVQVLVPRRWLHALLGKSRYRSTALAGVMSVAGMM